MSSQPIPNMIYPDQIRQAQASPMSQGFQAGSAAYQAAMQERYLIDKHLQITTHLASALVPILAEREASDLGDDASDAVDIAFDEATRMLKKYGWTIAFRGSKESEASDEAVDSK